MTTEIRQVIEALSRTIRFLEEANESRAEKDVEVYVRLDRDFNFIMRNLFPSIHWSSNDRLFDLTGFEVVDYRLRKIERTLLDIASTERRCNFDDDMANRFPKFLTALDDSEATSKGVNNLSKNLSDWFIQKTAVVVDPWIFSNGNQDETKYCKAVSDILIKYPERIDFYFSREGYKFNVAQKIVNLLDAEFKRNYNFYECTNLHDRIWMRHYEVSDNPRGDKWQGRVVGSSVNNAHERPTYIIDMPNDDAIGYARYLRKIRKEATYSKDIPI